MMEKIIGSVGLLSVPLFAFLYRCRGGFLGLGSTTLARIIYWDIPVGLSVGLSTNIWCGISAFIMADIGLRIPFNSSFQGDSVSGYLGMALAGITRLALILLVPIIYNYDVIRILPIGLFSGVAYLIGWKVLNGIDSGIRVKDFLFFKDGSFAKGGSEWGEVITGAIFGLAFYLLGNV